ncbi:MAG: DVU0298 family protein [Dehalococcoidia bacterium]
MRSDDKSIPEQVKTALAHRDYVKLLDLCEKDGRCWRALKSAIYEADENIYRPAIEAAAGLMQRWWEQGRREQVKEYVRSLLWSLNDESGGIGWNAPQAIAEIILAIPELEEPYGSMMISSSLSEPPLVKSGLWAIGRLGKRAEKVIEMFQDMIFGVFNNSDTQTIGLAAWAVGEVGFAPALPFLEALVDRKEPVQIYIDGSFCKEPLGFWASEALKDFGH